MPSAPDGQAFVENDIQTGGSREGQTHRRVQRRVDNDMCREGQPGSLVIGKTGHLGGWGTLSRPLGGVA